MIWGAFLPDHCSGQCNVGRFVRVHRYNLWQTKTFDLHLAGLSFAWKIVYIIVSHVDFESLVLRQSQHTDNLLVGQDPSLAMGHRWWSPSFLLQIDSGDTLQFVLFLLSQFPPLIADWRWGWVWNRMWINLISRHLPTRNSLFLCTSLCLSRTSFYYCTSLDYNWSGRYSIKYYFRFRSWYVTKPKQALTVFLLKSSSLVSFWPL